METVAYIPIADVATSLGVSVDTVRRWIRQQGNPLRAVTIGRRLYTKQEWVDEFANPVEHVELPDSSSSRRFFNRWKRSAHVSART